MSYVQQFAEALSSLALSAPWLVAVLLGGSFVIGALRGLYEPKAPINRRRIHKVFVVCWIGTIPLLLAVLDPVLKAPFQSGLGTALLLLFLVFFAGPMLFVWFVGATYLVGALCGYWLSDRAAE